MTKTFMTIGKFDGFHLGHQLLLNDIIDKYKKAVEMGTADEAYKCVIIKLRSGKDALYTEEEEKRFIKKAFPEIDDIIYLDFNESLRTMSPEVFVKSILVDSLDVCYIAVGSDFRFGKDRAGDINILNALGHKYNFSLAAKDKLIVDGEVVSSTRIRDIIHEGDVMSASSLLGRGFSFEGIVSPGKKLGRTLGFPTINIPVIDGKILPKYGVYSTRIYIGDEKTVEYRGITNVGIRPSVDDGDIPTVETFIYDFNDDLYGSFVKVELMDFIRQEMSFNSLDDLKKQIALDIERARHQ